MTSVAIGTEAPLVALCGNPNAGKTTLFNALTGAYQKVANFPGVTVEKAVGTFTIEGQPVTALDVPGLYSLNAISEDEVVAVKALRGEDLGEQPRVIVYVMDASNLERNLFFYSELSDWEKPMVVALTMSDVLTRRGVEVDVEHLQTLLGVRVVPVVAHKGIGLDALKRAILVQLEAPQPTPPVGKEAGSPSLLTTAERYEWASAVREEVVSSQTKPGYRSTTQKIDGVLTHRVFGLIIFVAVMYLVFQSIYTVSEPLMNGIGWVVDQGKSLVGGWLAGVPMLQSLVVDGLIQGVGSVLTFLPQILILFFFIAALEGTGYLARSAFLMDRLFGWCGLSGRAFIPLLSSFACAIPGILAARVMPDSKSRLATILIAPLMSCSARLPVYVVLIGAFIEPKFGPAWAGFALFAMHVVGVVVAIPVVLIVNRQIFKGKRLPFLLELPNYQWPKWRDVWLTMYLRAKTFVQTAGTIIVVMSVLIWALLYFPRQDAANSAYRAEYAGLPASVRSKVTEQHFLQERHVANSYLGRFGRSIEPLFRPAGFDWRLSTAILAAFPAREVVVPSLGIIFNLGGEVDEGSNDLRGALQEATWPDGRPLFTPWVAASMMVFFALCCQCMSTLATVRRETNSWRWPAFMFSYMTILAYVAAVAIHQLGLWLG